MVKKLKILIAEDDENQRKMIQLFLKSLQHKYEIIIVNDGLQAIEIMKKNPIDLLVTDLKMPKIEGVVLISYLNRNFPKIPCIVMTAMRSPVLKKKLQKDVMFYLEKPFNKTVFISAIEESIDNTRITGTLKGITIVSFMQLINIDQKTCICEVQSPNQSKGRLFFMEGEIFDAEYKELDGEPAALAILQFDRVTINFETLTELQIKRKIHTKMTPLIMEGMHIKDESNKSKQLKELGNLAWDTEPVINV